MPYLPPNPTVGAAWPQPYGADVATAIRMIADKWKRQFPALDYYQLKKATTPSDDPNTPTGEPGNTMFDPIWGESVPVDMATGWRQPHGNTTPDAPNPELFEPPVKLHMRVQREAKEKELKKYGFDQVRDLLAFVPLSLLDEAGVTVKQGDYFVWDGDEYVVLQFDRVGYWKNTNVRLYMALNCEHRRPGS